MVRRCPKIGDETALPAIGRWVESRRADVPVNTIAVIGGDAERQDFATGADWDATWVLRSNGQADDAGLLQAALTAWMKASGYWVMGQADAHVSLDEWS